MRQIKIQTTHTGGTQITVGNEMQTYAYRPSSVYHSKLACASINAIMYTGWHNLGKRLTAKLTTAITNHARHELAAEHRLTIDGVRIGW